LDSAHRCLGCSSQILRYAIATSRALRNPAADLRGALQPAHGGHFASITDPEIVGQLLRAIDGYQGNSRTRCALRLAPLTFVRPNELRKAQWAHFNLDTAEWRIPALEMKMKGDHIVPLSRQAIDVLHELQPLTVSGKYLFRCERSATRPMSANTVNAALRRLGYSGDEMVGHGFRAMARTILDEVLGYRVDWIEHQLAHRVLDPNARAYNRTSHLSGRKDMMQGWADYLDRLRATNVVSIARQAA
jgi:integrase